MKRITQKILSYIRLAYIIIKYGKNGLFTVLLFICFSSHSQVYVGSYLGYSTSRATIYNYNTKQQETYKSDYLFYSLPVGYNYKSWLVESGGFFNGNVYTHISAGRNILLTDNFSFDLLAGESASLAFKKGFHVIQKISPQLTARLNFGALSVQGSYTNRTYMVGVGIKGNPLR